jgi:hypothetical protein
MGMALLYTFNWKKTGGVRLGLMPQLWTRGARRKGATTYIVMDVLEPGHMYTVMFINVPLKDGSDKFVEATIRHRNHHIRHARKQVIGRMDYSFLR